MDIEVLEAPRFWQIPYVPYSGKSNKWNGKDRCLLSRLFYKLIVNGRVVELDIPYGFITDLGSIPDFLQGFVVNNDESLLGFIPHDFLFHADCPIQLDRSETDAILKALMEYSGQTWLRTQTTHKSVIAGRITVPYQKAKMMVDALYADRSLNYAESLRKYNN